MSVYVPLRHQRSMRVANLLIGISCFAVQLYILVHLIHGRGSSEIVGVGRLVRMILYHHTPSLRPYVDDELELGDARGGVFLWEC